MKTTATHELLRAYAENHSESAFQELVYGYVDLVYSAALDTLANKPKYSNSGKLDSGGHAIVGRVRLSRITY